MSKNQQQKDWYKKTLEKIDNIMSSDKDIVDKYLEIYKYTRIALDGEPTTADKYNDDISQYEDHEIQSEIKNFVQYRDTGDENDFGETRNAQNFSASPENTVRLRWRVFTNVVIQ